MHITDQKFLSILRCPTCFSSHLSYAPHAFLCSKCITSYPVVNSIPQFLSQTLKEQYEQYMHEIKLPVNRLKTAIKGHPIFFQFLKQAVGSVSFFGQSPQRAIKDIWNEEKIKEKIIINIGSGTQNIHPDVINVDIFAFHGVNLVADATTLPFADNSIDMLISESTLEHIPKSDVAIAEMKRVIKPGGWIFVSIPFLLPFHASPNDYTRLTHEGLKQKFDNFTKTKTGMRGGPVSALISFLMHFFALPFSIISGSLYNIAAYCFMIVLSPLRILDPIFYLFPKSIDAAAVVYFIGEKKR